MYQYPLEMFSDELYISYLSRLYARYGFIEVSKFNKEFFKNSKKTIDLDIINPMNVELLTVSIENLIKGSLFTYQYMFIGGKKLEKIYNSLVLGDGNVQKLNMVITPVNNKRFLKYCPICSREEEPYFHTVHQYMPICLKHKARLVESSIVIYSREKITYKTLIEESREDTVEKINIPTEQIRFYEYVEQVVNNGIDFNAKGTISDYLTYWVNKRQFTTIRQNAVKVRNFYRYSKNKFSTFVDFDFPTLSSFKTVLKGNSFNSFTILVMAFTLEISSNELSHHIKKNRVKSNVIKIKKLYSEGYSQEEICKEFNVTRQYISKIINERY